MEQIVFFVLMLALGYSIGTLVESRHYKSIEQREHALIRLPAVNFKHLPNPEQVKRTWLVQGSVVISHDFFKRILASLRNIIGGRVGSYETLIDRGRREALLRMKEAAENADMVLNVRVETSTIGANAQKRKALGMIEVLAYGTAVELRR